ncbi:hypothetical protein SSABA_v1c06700 [Spiroplasma sabaudiense Ar-1343]|uniref:Transmembrane protein n=1 Tax=Spiroplasma sabaudiense Ar-1343 TaxID=1276257 RepID=W6AAI7_9MOLU|nr:hypothetical protein [Spiroplasma sabaudiense]AHI54072.1 hypothetical protein SSABA_v1c06700 [Spiroplasma sabaudiense Ar-1343]
MSYVRSRIILFNILGMCFALLGYALFASALFGNFEGFKIEVEQFNPLDQVLIAIALAYFTYAVWKTVFFGMKIIKFVKTKSDEDIIANRFILAVYSLTLGGFVTPFMLTKIPNVDSQSTLNPRNEIAKVYTVNYVVGGAILIGSFFAFGASLNADFFSPTTQLASSIFLGITGAGMLLGLIGGIFFWRKNSNEAYAKNGFMKFIAGIFIVIVTVELLLKIVSAIITIIQAIADIFQSGRQNFLVSLLIWMQSMITIMYSFFLITICWATIKGIWSKEGVTMKEYAGLSKAQEKNGTVPSWKNN